MIQKYAKSAKWLQKYRNYVYKRIHWSSPEDATKAYEYFYVKRRQFLEEIEPEFDLYCKRMKLSLKEVNERIQEYELKRES